jgi:hypothetical protein
LDLETAMSLAVARAIDRKYVGPDGRRPLSFQRVFKEWPTFNDEWVNPSAVVLPDGDLLYGPSHMTPTLMEDTWEVRGEPGFGLYKLDEATKEFDIGIRARTQAERNALKAGIEQIFVDDAIILAPLANKARNGIIVPMPEYWGLSCRLHLVSSRKLDDAAAAAANRWEALIHVRADAPHVKLGIVQPFRLSLKVVETSPIVAQAAPIVIVPQAPAPGPRFWFDGFAVDRSGSDVTAWADQSGNDNDATFVGMPGGSRHLQYVGSSPLNGLPGLQGSQDFSPQGLVNLNGGNIYTGGDPRTVFAMVTFGGLGAFGSLGGFPFTFRRSAAMFGLGVFTEGPPKPPGHQIFYTDFATTIEAVTPIDYSHTSRLVRWQTDPGGTTLQTYIDSVLVAETAMALGDELGASGFIIGNLINDDGHAVFEGYLHEIIGYDGSLAAPAVLTTESYLNSKWRP